MNALKRAVKRTLRRIARVSPYRENCFKRVAVHEASHAVVAICLDNRIEKLESKIDCGLCLWYGKPTDAVSLAAVSMAGFIGDQLSDNDMPLPLAAYGTDWSNFCLAAKEIKIAACDNLVSDSEIDRELRAFSFYDNNRHDYVQLYAIMAPQIKAILTEQWGLVQLIAAELCTEGEIFNEQLARIIQLYSDSCVDTLPTGCDMHGTGSKDDG